jgi:hypothetical protein
MSSIAITSSATGTGVITLAAPVTATNRTITLPDATGTLLISSTTSGFPAGTVLQVISATKTDTFSTTSSSYIDVTGWTASITPRNTASKILVMASGALSNSADNSFTYVKLVRGATDIYLGDARGSATRASADASASTAASVSTRSVSVSIHFVDSPNSAGAVTYKLQIITTNGGTAIVGGTSNTSDLNRSNIPATITLMEIAA